MARRILPAEDSRLTLFLNTEAQLYWNKEDFAQAEPLFREVLRIEQKKETRDPFAAATAYSNLGRMLMSKGDLDEAEPYLRHTEKLRRDNIKGENFIIGLAMFNVGDWLFQKGKYDEAEKTLRRVIEIYRRDGNGAAQMANALHLLARILHAKNQLDEAEKLYREALIEVPKSWEVQILKHRIPHNLALLLIDKGQPGSCEPMLRDALRGLRDIFHENHGAVGNAESALGKCLTALGRYAEAEPLLKSGYEKLRANSRFGDNHPATREALNRLRHLSEAQKKR